MLKQSDVCCLFEVKEKSSDEIKIAKIYYRSKINSSDLDRFIELYEKEVELKIENVLIYEKYVVTEKSVILIMKKYECNLEDFLKKKDLNKMNEIMLKLIKCIKRLEEIGVIYNNLKLNNIFIDDKEDVKKVKKMI